MLLEATSAVLARITVQHAQRYIQYLVRVENVDRLNATVCKTMMRSVTPVKMRPMIVEKVWCAYFLHRYI